MPKGRSFSVYLFDLDGTLIDSTALITSAFAHTLRTHRCPEPEADTLRAGFGTPLRTQLAKLSRDPAEVDAMAATYRTYHAAHHDRLVRPFPGINGQIAALRSRQTKLGIVTSKGRTAVAQGLQRCGLEGAFDVLVTADDVRKHKPHPAPVRSALEQLPAAADEAVFVGDSPHDLESGRAAGVHTAAALWGAFTRPALAPYRPDYWLESPRDIALVLSRQSNQRE